MKTFSKIKKVILLLILITSGVTAQDSLSTKHVEGLSYTFQLTDGTLSGNGADFLFDRMANAQYTLLGEFHGSKNISELTDALIPKLNQYGYDHLVLEVGPHTGDLFNTLPNDKDGVVEELKKVNQKYLRIEDGEVSYPIPFFNKVEDARFLGAAKSAGWNILGIDQEYLDGYLLLLDQMHEKLTPAEQEFHAVDYAMVRDTISKMYNDWIGSNTPIYSAIVQSSFVQMYLNQMQKYPTVREIVADFRKSVEIYQMNALGQWYENNGTRIKYMKEKLRTGLEQTRFDIGKDKLLIKMGGYHMSQGFSPLGFYEVGNMLNELAEYHGNTALNIGFINRFSFESNKVVDALNEENVFIERLRNFYSLGGKDEWVVIDLEPLRKGFYYHPQQFKLSTYEEELIQRFDVLIITPTEFEGINNY